MTKFIIYFERAQKDLTDIISTLRKLGCQNIGVDWKEE